MPTEKIKIGLLEAEFRGEEELKKFTEERLINQTVDFYELIKRPRLGSFASVRKTVKVKTNSKVVQFSAQSDIFVKIPLMQEIRNVDLNDVFCYPRGPVLWTLATSNRKLIKASKIKTYA